ncbi:RNA polymerase sigma factor [Catellatospora bangladeshensis]|uniref:DNA-directed RNA polymerase sigma-70 factor n=1 Tax=Catellatospora bangladeshensis TaxID=310355 RepID=A0A8J3NK65_9ACTN|nr:sigma-70 family RNA polymerase sigma factor [Catellatospora bangladeshensis]GIF82723.1 DNA-directed RNA polymerase sigma-70 factor [Catellatospora bangladeshensis]
MTAAAGAGTVPAEGRAAVLAGLLEKAREGDRGALDAIVREVNPLLWHVARAQGLDAEPAADVVQTTWLVFVRHLDTIRTPQALLGWLATTTRREAWRLLRQERAGADPDSEVVEHALSPAADVDEQVLTHERDRALWRALQAVSDRCRRLLRVVALVDRPDYDVLAEAMGMPRGSIGPTRGRCLAKVRELLLADPTWSR